MKMDAKGLLVFCSLAVFGASGLVLPPPIPIIPPIVPLHITADAIKVGAEAVETAVIAYHDLVQSTISDLISLGAGIASGDLSAWGGFLQSQQEAIASYGSKIVSTVTSLGSAWPAIALPEIPGLEWPDLSELNLETISLPPLPSSLFPIPIPGIHDPIVG